MEKLKSVKMPGDGVTPSCVSPNSPVIQGIAPLISAIDVSESIKRPRFSGNEFDLIFEVKELQSLNCQEISRLLKENENFSLMHISENGSILQVDVDKLLRFLPLHLTAMVLSTKKDEAMLRYLLSGLRLLHSFCEIASRHPKLEQILLDDVRVSEQLLDMVFYVLIICSANKQGNHFSGAMPLLYAAIVACSMYLLTACISSQWNELAFVLHCHPKVDIFIDVAFGAVRRNFNFIQTNLSADDYTRYSNPSLAVERAVYFHCQQCEASLQFLQQMCQNKSFQERFLKNKELCGKGGVLRLVKAALNLNTPLILEGSCAVIAAFSRIKARVLSILLYLCEAESVSYLDEVASIPESLDLAKSVALEVVELLKTTLSNESKRPENYSGKTYPMGLLQLNALRLADIFSDDSNLRSYITIYFAEVLAAVLSIPYQQFLSSWCSSDLLLKEEDVSLDYEPFTMAGWVLDLSSPLDICNVEICESNFIPIGSTQASYAHQRTSLLVKVIANLHCFVPNICKEQERNLFLHKFLDCLNIEWQDPHAGDSFPSQPWPGVAFSSALQIAATVCKNLRSLLGHAESLIPTFLNEEDVQLFRVFFTQVQSLIGPVDLEVNRAWEINNTRDSSSPLHGGKELDPKFSNIILKEGMSENSAFPGVCNPDAKQELVGDADGVMQDVNRCEVKLSKSSRERVTEVENAETSGSDLSSSRGKNKNLVGQVSNGEATKSCENSHKSNIQGSQEDERVESLNCEEKPTRKRKRHIMNDIQASLFERAVQEEPDIHKNAASLHAWAVTLSCHGSEVTSAQLKNWLNNRKAKLLRAAAKDGRLSSEDSLICDKQDGSKTRPFSELPQGLKEDRNQTATAVTCIRPNMSQNVEITPESSAQLNPQNCQVSNTNSARLMAGQAVTLTDPQGKEIAKGTVFQVEGEWHGCNLADTSTCVVDITELKSDRIVRLPHPSIEGGATFEQAEVKVGNMRVLWDFGRIRTR
ncbi:nodulin homeobox isoform X1 [Silene latifolia]|uniref:nodulin homeobox isoform X1 n=2 Tax=Silene latifolia TaxID=37657 RepID=UPI003D76CFCF